MFVWSEPGPPQTLGSEDVIMKAVKAFHFHTLYECSLRWKVPLGSFWETCDLKGHCISPAAASC